MGEKRKQEAAEAHKLKEQHREGSSSEGCEQQGSLAKPSVIEGEGAAEKGAHVVQVIISHTHTHTLYMIF